VVVVVFIMLLRWNGFSRSVGPNVLLSVFPSVVHKELSMNTVWFNHANQPIKMQLVLRMLQAL
jgi:hypothetical protein